MKRFLLISAGWISVTLGAIGVIVPLLPTTPFLLLALACFSKSSPKFHTWLTSHKLLGKYINFWNENKTISTKVKIRIALLILVTLSISLYSLDILMF